MISMTVALLPAEEEMGTGNDRIRSSKGGRDMLLDDLHEEEHERESDDNGNDMVLWLLLLREFEEVCKFVNYVVWNAF